MHCVFTSVCIYYQCELQEAVSPVKMAINAALSSGVIISEKDSAGYTALSGFH